MFQVTASMQAAWAAKGKPKATAADIQAIETATGARLASPYVEFVTQFGFVLFGDDDEARCMFSYTLVYEGRVEQRQSDIAFMNQPDRLIRAWRTLTGAADPSDETLPAFPANYLPIGNDSGQGQILLELSPESGRIWYWPEREWAWGKHDNTVLGRVANDFYSFINSLRP